MGKKNSKLRTKAYTYSIRNILLTESDIQNLNQFKFKFELTYPKYKFCFFFFGGGVMMLYIVCFIILYYCNLANNILCLFVDESIIFILFFNNNH